MSDIYKEAVIGGIRGVAGYLISKLNPVKQEIPEEMTLEEAADKVKNAGRNFRGGVIGVGCSVALELLSPNGSKTSALAAAVAGGVVLHYSKPVLNAAPQNAVLSTTAGVSAGYVAMVVGRAMSSYFPGSDK